MSGLVAWSVGVLIALLVIAFFFAGFIVGMLYMATLQKLWIP